MNQRPLRIFLLACVTFWATGLAQFTHERLEHGAGQTSSKDFAALGVSTASATIDSACVDGDSHDDCQTCLMLAAMRADRVAAAALPLPVQPLIDVVAV